MALVRVIKSTIKDRSLLHGETECLASVFTDDEGRSYLP
jgi:hypothetical protein